MKKKTEKTLSQNLHDLVSKQDYKKGTAFFICGVELDPETGLTAFPTYQRGSNIEKIGMIELIIANLEAEKEQVIFGEPVGAPKDVLDVAIDSVYNEMFADIRQSLLSNDINSMAVDFVSRLKKVKDSIKTNDLNDGLEESMGRV